MKKPPCSSATLAEQLSERLIGSIRVIGKARPRRVLHPYASYCNQRRTHEPWTKTHLPIVRLRLLGALRSRPNLGLTSPVRPDLVSVHTVIASLLSKELKVERRPIRLGHAADLPKMTQACVFPYAFLRSRCGIGVNLPALRGRAVV